MIKGIEHIAIFSSNTEALKDWYIKLFDFKQVYDNGKGTYFLQSPDGSMLEFCTADTVSDKFNQTVSGIRHIALATDNIEEMTEKILAEGAEVVTPLSISTSGVGTFFFRDIDGNILHLISRVTPLA